MGRQQHVSKNAKRARKPNPREERNNLRLVSNNSVDTIGQTRKKIVIEPRNENQKIYLSALQDEDVDITIACGPSGVGKTLIPTLHAASLLREGKIKKIVIARPMITADETSPGAVPGTLIDKLIIWNRPIIDNLLEHMSKTELLRLLEEEIIEIVAIGMLRGRSFRKGTYIIIDEAQNTSCEQMKMVLTRIETGAKMVITGDLRQHDRRGQTIGLKDAIERLEGIPGIEIVIFNQSDVERNPIIEAILDAYEE